MLASILMSVTLLNSFNLGVSFGPAIPTGYLSSAYKASTSVSVLTSYRRLELSYAYSNFPGQHQSNENLSLHSFILGYRHSLYTTDTRDLSAQIGTGYHYARRSLNAHSETGYGLGVFYALKYVQKISDAKLKPSFSASLITDQIIQTRNWRAMQISSSAFVLKVLVGLQIKLL